jgi:hypothetical protein
MNTRKVKYIKLEKSRFHPKYLEYQNLKPQMLYKVIKLS